MFAIKYSSVSESSENVKCMFFYNFVYETGNASLRILREY